MLDSVNPTKFLCSFINIYELHHSREQSTFMSSLALPLTPKCKVTPLRRIYYPDILFIKFGKIQPRI